MSIFGISREEFDKKINELTNKLQLVCPHNGIVDKIEYRGFWSCFEPDYNCRLCGKTHIDKKDLGKDAKIEVSETKFVKVK